MSGSVEFRMPDVGEGIAEAEVLSWSVAEGQHVDADDPLCQVETDKSIVELPAPVAGTIGTLHVEPGTVATVGTLLVEIVADQAQQPAPSGASPETDHVSQAPGPERRPVTAGRRPMASPRTRRIAVQRGIDLAGVVGSGPHGRILEADLDRPAAPVADRAPASSAPAFPGRADEVVPLTGLRRSTARSMTQALTIPHVTEFREIDATRLIAARDALRPSFEARGARLSILPLLLASVARALRAHPSMNATYDADTETLTRRGGVHLGVATATTDGLLVPVVRDADLLTLAQLVDQVDRLTQQARDRTVAPGDLADGSCTVTNFGSFGAWLGTPIIRPPEVAIVGFGRVTDKVVAVDGQPVVRPVLPLVAATDHRVNDGAHLAGFLDSVAAAAAEPLLLLGPEVSRDGRG